MQNNKPCGMQDAEVNAQISDALSAPILVLNCECGKQFDFHNTEENKKLNIWAGSGNDSISVCSRKCKHIYENGSDPHYDELYEEMDPRFRHNDYVLAWNYYVGSCKRSNERITLNLTHYMRMVPQSQVDDMIKYYELS